jgi:sugar-specific transcriptional regulator TrmB
LFRNPKFYLLLPYILSLKNVRGEIDISSEEIRALESLGLSSIQAKAYLALTQLGRAKAGEIYKNAGVARQDVYRVLEKLQEVGLIEKIISSPAEYVPTPFRNGLTMLVKRKRAEFEENAKKVEKIRDIIYPTNISKQEGLSQSLTATVEIEVLNSKTRSSFETVTQSIEYVTNWEAFIRGSLETLKEARKAFRRGIKAKTVIELPKYPLTIPKAIQTLIQDRLLDVRTVDSIPFFALGIFDKKEIVFTPLHQRTTQGNTYWSKNIGFVELANSYFETMWNKADLFDRHAMQKILSQS